MCKRGNVKLWAVHQRWVPSWLLNTCKAVHGLVHAKTLTLTT